MIGISASQFKSNSMNFDIYKLTILFMAGYERPSYNPSTNHIEDRKQMTANWYTYVTGQPAPPVPPIVVTAGTRSGRRAILFKKR